MNDDGKKKRIRSVILMSALGAVACGGQATGEHTDDGEGDGDHSTGQPIGDFVGEIPTGGTGGIPYLGTGGALVVGLPCYGGAGGAESACDEFIGIPR